MCVAKKIENRSTLYKDMNNLDVLHLLTYFVALFTQAICRHAYCRHASGRPFLTSGELDL